MRNSQGLFAAPKILCLIVSILVSCAHLSAQSAKISGSIVDRFTNEPLPFANISIPDLQVGTISDENGKFEMQDLKPGLVNIQATYLGYESQMLFEYELFANKTAEISFELEATSKNINEVEITTSAFSRPAESSTSVRSIGLNEIKRAPGANRDISKVIQALPGVGATVSFRNDILIRGGSPAENAFYLDGIEVPTINHFSTQGASGGPVGLINVDLIKKVQFYSSSFPASSGGALSSVMDIKLRDGRTDRLGANFTLGASETAVSIEGPWTKKKKSSFLFSVRRSYLQLLFKLFDLPFLPTYNDFQLKTKIKINERNQLTIIGLGAYDQFELNLEANETPEQQYLLGTLPENGQWNYTFGAKHTLFTDKGYFYFVAGRSHLRNFGDKFENNESSDESKRIVDYDSDEIENKLRVEHTLRTAGFKLNYGLAYENIRYKNVSFVRRATSSGLDTLNYNSEITLNNAAIFAQLSWSYFDDRLKLSFGTRLELSDYNSETKNPLKQFSPRLAASFEFSPAWRLNAGIGRYHQLPPLTFLGFKVGDDFVNRDAGVRYIRSTHYTLGLDRELPVNARISAEGFFKLYDHYPFVLQDSVSLANLGGDFGVVGDQPGRSISEGMAYGLELMYEQKLYKNFFGILSYTWFWSEFSDDQGNFSPSAWDNRHIISLTAGKKFKRNWELGIKWKGAGGNPYSPYDIETSALKEVWQAQNQGIVDYSEVNTLRLNWSHQLDLRIDKKYYFKNFFMEFYFDIQNAYDFKSELPAYLDVVRDDEGNPIEDPNDPSRYQTYLLQNTDGQLLPSIGIVLGY